MIQLIIMLIWLVALAAICLKYTKGAYLSPQFAFTACFIPAVAYSFIFIKTWELDYAPWTVAVLLGGCTLFAAVSFLTSYLIDKIKPKIKVKQTHQNADFGLQVCSKWHLIAFIVVQAATLIGTFAFLINIYGKFDITAAIAHFNNTNKFSDTVIELPSIIGKLRILSFASGFVWAYILAHSIIHKTEKYILMRILLGINFLLSIVNTLSTGSRTEAVVLLLGAVVLFLLIYSKEHGWKLSLKPKHYLFMGGGAAAVVLSFRPLGNLLGRRINQNIVEYIGIYLSAEIKNLDTFIREGVFGAPVERWQTLINAVNMFARRFNIPEWVHKFDIPFREIHGRSLGNVATTFYAWLYDGGYLAVILFTVVMAAICQIIYKLAIRKSSGSSMAISELIYSYVFFTIVFSFFSNKFYEHIFSGHFIFLVIFWILLKIYVEWFNFKNCKTLIINIVNKIKSRKN